MLQAVRTACEAGSGHSRVATGIPASACRIRAGPLQARRRERDDLVLVRLRPPPGPRASRGCSCRSRSAGATAARRRRRSSSWLVVERVEVHTEPPAVASARNRRRADVEPDPADTVLRLERHTEDGVVRSLEADACHRPPADRGDDGLRRSRRGRRRCGARPGAHPACSFGARSSTVGPDQVSFGYRPVQVTSTLRATGPATCHSVSPSGRSRARARPSSSSDASVTR